MPAQVPALTRGIAVLRLLASAPAPLALNEIARAVGIFPSTCLNILRVLVGEELLAVDSAKRYRLNAGMLALVRPLLRNDGPAQALQPRLDWLASRFNVTAALVEVIGLKHFIVVAVSRAEGLRLQIEVGRRAPALISATGRCVAAFGNHAVESLVEPFQALRWDDPPSFDEWLGQVRATRRRGYAVDEGNFIGGMTTVAVPLQSAGTLRHCITAVGISDQIKRTGREELAQALLSVSADAEPRTAAALVSA